LELYKKALEIKLKQEFKETNELLGIMGATPLTYDDLFQGVLIQAKEQLNNEDRREIYKSAEGWEDDR
jgi:hypothetical protein